MLQVTTSDVPPSPASPTPRSGRRAYALDALRGLAILAMVWSALVPYGQGPFGMLPSWMYHAQNPPPSHEFRPDLPGITWVDLVFPFFLFSMGAAIPLALSRRLEKGTPLKAIVAGILWRGVLLAAFALFREHVSPYGMNPNPTTATWLTALGAMALVFFVWGRFPEAWKPWQRTAWHAVGWLCAIVLLASIRYPDGGNLDASLPALRQWVQRGDIIILVLANVSVFGSLIWLVTRNSWWARLAAAGVMLALKISAAAPGWTRELWAWTPAPWLYKMEFLKYLMIVVPATIVGDMLVAWMRGSYDPQRADAREDAPAPEAAATEGSHAAGADAKGETVAVTAPAAWPAWRLASAGLLAFALSAVATIGMTGTYLPEVDALAGRAVLPATLILLSMAAGIGWLVRGPHGELETLLARLYQWGLWWLVFGLLFEPYEGGIQKGRPTIAYFFTTLGLGIFMLMAFIVWIDGFRGRRAAGLFIATGQNPLLAYIGHSNLIAPIWALTGLSAWLMARLVTPWQGALHAACLTLLLALVVSGLTRLRVFVRA